MTAARTKEDLQQLIIPLLAISCSFIVIPSATPALGTCLVLKLNGFAISVLAGGAALFAVLIAGQITGCCEPAAAPTVDTDNLECAIAFQEVPEVPAVTEPINLIAQIHHLEPEQFERLMARVYYKLGYAITHCSHTDLDTNIDLIVHKNSSLCAIHCKSWRTWNLGVRPLRALVEDLAAAGIENAVVITLNGYTAAAKRLADEHRIQFIDEFALAKMFAHCDAAFDPEVLSILAS